MKNRRATTIMELVVAMGIIIVGILTVVGLIARSINAGSIAKNKLLSLMYAQEGIEVARQIRDSNFLKIDSGRLTSEWDEGLSAVNGADTSYVAIANPVYPPSGTNLFNGIWSFTFKDAAGVLDLTKNQTTVLQTNPTDHRLYQATTLQTGPPAYTNTSFHRVISFEPICADSGGTLKNLSELACAAEFTCTTPNQLSIMQLQAAPTCDHYSGTKVGVHIVSTVRWGINNWNDAVTRNDPNQITVTHDVYNWR